MMFVAGQLGQALDADVAQAARADDHAGGAGVEQRESLADRVVGGDAGVGEGRDVLGLRLRVQLDAGPGRGQQVLGHAAVPGQAGELAVLAVHVVAGPAGVAQAVGRCGVQDDGVADGHVGDRRADLVHPARVLVAEDVGQRGAHGGVPLPLDDVQVGPADAGAADLHDDVERPADLRLGHVVDHRLGVEFMQPDGLHGSSSTCFAVYHSVFRRVAGGAVSPCPWVLLYLCRSMPRQMPEFASMLTRVTLALRRCSGRVDSAVTGAPVTGSISSGASSPAGRPRSARRERNRSSAREGGSSPSVIASSAACSLPAASSGLHT